MRITESYHIGDSFINITESDKYSAWMNENARILSALENRLRAGFV